MQQGIEYASFPETLGKLFLEGKHSVVVAGTHGKTTTTSLIAWLLHHAQKAPGLLVGGVPANFDEGFIHGEGDYFVVEGDEYDTAFFDKGPKFLHYQPQTAIVTSLEFDHADIYQNVEAIEARFAQLVGLVPADGTIYACASAARVMALMPQAKAKVVSYSAREDTSADWTSANTSVSPEGVEFDLLHKEQTIGRFKYGLTGTHNVENAVAALAFCLEQGISQEILQEGLNKFQGVARRQTVRAEISGIRIIDDFAHHPTAVKETVAAIKARYSEGTLWAIFEPRTATSSRKYFQQDYVEAFDQANQTIIAAVGRKELAEAERLDEGELAAGIAARGHGVARHIAEVDEIVRHLAENAQAGDTLLFMSNGGFGGIYQKIEAALRGKSAT